MKKVLLLLGFFIFVFHAIPFAQERKMESHFRVYKKSNKGFDPQTSFLRKYIPGDTVDLKIAFSWKDLDIKKVTLVFPSGTNIISGEALGTGWDKMQANINENSVYWEGNGMSSYVSPAETSIKLIIPETLSGDQPVTCTFIGGGWGSDDVEVTNTATLSQLGTEPKLVLSTTIWDAGIIQASSTITSQAEVSAFNDGLNDLVISGFTNLADPFSSTAELPITIKAQETFDLPFEFYTEQKGIKEATITINSNGGNKDVTFVGAAYDNAFAYIDFEDYGVQFPPIGWQIVKLASQEEYGGWHANLGEIDIMSSGDPDSSYLISPFIDLTHNTDRFIGFNLFINKDDTSHIDIEYSLDEGSTWLVFEKNITAGTGMNNEYYKSLENITGQKVIFRLKGVCKYGYLGIDNLVIPDYYNPNTAPGIVSNNIPVDNATSVSMAANFSWDKVLFADGYKLYLDTLPDPVVFYDLGNTSRFNADLKQLTDYYWKVVPYNQHGDAVNCPVWKFKTEKFIPTAWTKDIETNTRLTFGEGEKALPIITLNDSSEAFMTWFAIEDGNYNLKLQKLNKDGNELFRRNGMMVSSHTQATWISDYDMKLDNQGNVLTALSDIRNGGNDVYIYKIAPDGTMLWGDDGINLSENQDMDMYSPSLLTDSKGNIYVNMANGSDGSSDIVRLNAIGENVLGTTFTNPGQVVDMKINASDQLVIGYYADNIYYLNILDSLFQSVLNEPVAFSTSPDFPYWGRKTGYIEPDKNGGVYTVWVGADGFNATIKWQYVNKNGQIIKGAAGEYISTNRVRGHSYPHVIYSKSDDKLYVTWDEQVSGAVGLYAQILNSDGSVDFGEAGKEIIAISDSIAGTDGIALQGDKLIWLFSNYDSGEYWGNYLNAMFLNKNFEILDPGFIRFSSLKNDKRINSIASNDKMLVADWVEQKESEPSQQVFAQNLYMDGSMGILGPDTVPPMAKSVKVLSNEKLLITFNEPVLKDSAEVISAYSISGDGEPTVTSCELLYPTQVLLHVSGMQEGELKLTMKNITDLANNTNAVQSIIFNFIPDNQLPEVITVKPVADNKIVVRFSEAIIASDLENTENYQLTGAVSTIESIDVITNMQIVLHTPTLSEGNYSLTINHFTDLMENTASTKVVNFSYKANTGSLNYLSEDFSNGIPDDYTLYNLDNATPSDYTSIFTEAWMGLEMNDGNVVVGSTSMYTPAARADDWIVTNKIIVQKSPYLFWSAVAISANFADGYQVWVSTTGNEPEDFKVKVFEISEEHYEWKNRWVDLSNYGFGDDTIYVAFRNNSYNKYVLVADDFRIYTPYKNDMAVLSSDIPTEVLSGGELAVTAAISNVGIDAIHSYKLNWQLGNGTVSSESIDNCSIDMGIQQLIQHETKLKLPENGGSYLLKIWTSLPNGIADENPANDTLKITLQVKQGYVQRLVLLEHFTNTGCGPCAEQNPFLEALLNENGNAQKALHVTYHVNWPEGEDPYYMASQVDADAQIEHYQVSGVPAVAVAGSMDLLAPTDVTQQMIDKEYLKPGLVKIDGKASYTDNDNNLGIALTLTNLANFNGKNPALFVVMAQTYYRDGDPASNGETFFPGVMKEILPSNSGDELTQLDSSSVNTFTYTYAMPEDMIINDAFVGVFVQDKESNEIYMAGKVDMVNSGIDQDIAGSLNIYPNPATNYLHITDQIKGDLSISTISGKCILRNTNFDSYQSLDISDLDNGLYLVTIRNNKGSFIAKLNILR